MGFHRARLNPTDLTPIVRRWLRMLNTASPTRWPKKPALSMVQRSEHHSQPGRALATRPRQNTTGAASMRSMRLRFSPRTPTGGVAVTLWEAIRCRLCGYDNCSGYGSYYASMWVGMDGSPNAPAGNEDVLQAGFEAGACPGGYYAWYEWYTVGCNLNASSAAYPCVEYNVNLPLTAGDYTYVTVTYNPTSPHGAAFLSNQTTGQYISVSFSRPAR